MTSQQADNSLATKQLEGCKQNKERLTLAVCCNVDGSDKLPLLVIGKYENPRCFKNVNRNNFGCKYRSNSKAWMTQVIFLEWLKGFDARMARRNVFLILDNYSAHISLMQLASVVTLRNTTVFYLPPNTTSKISALRRRNYPKPQRLLSAPFQSPPHSAPSGQGSRPRKDRRPRGYAHCCCSLEHGCEARNNLQLLSPLPNSHHRCWCDTGPRRAAYWPWGDQRPRRAGSRASVPEPNGYSQSHRLSCWAQSCLCSDSGGNCARPLHQSCDEVEANNIQESIPVKATEAL